MSSALRLRCVVMLVGVVVCAGSRIGVAQMPPPARPNMHAPLDEVLDLNVRDGLVYYRALKGTRGKLDQYAASLNVPAETVARWSRDEQKAFWLNAYNVFVLQTVIDN